MIHDFADDNKLLAAGTNCPIPDCRALVVTYRPANEEPGIRSDLWIFICPRCGLEFVTPQEDLLFQSAEKSWFSSEIYSA
jgi:hypothetical protein